MAANVVHLGPAASLFEAMLAGWERQQLARFLKAEETIRRRLALIRRFVVFSGSYPWQWTAAEVKERRGIGPDRRADRPGPGRCAAPRPGCPAS